ncbi:MAG: response regulator [Reichenbachiella sp.]
MIQFRQITITFILVFLIGALFLFALPFLTTLMTLDPLVIIYQSILISLGATGAMTIFGYFKQSANNDHTMEFNKTKKWNKISSLKNQSTVLFILLSMLPIVFIGFFFIRQISLEFKNEVIREKQESIQWTQLELSSTLFAMQRSLLQSAQTSEAKEFFKYSTANTPSITAHELSQWKNKIYNATYMETKIFPIIQTDYLQVNGSLLFSIEHTTFPTKGTYTFTEINSKILKGALLLKESDILLNKEFIGTSPYLTEDNLLLHTATPVFSNGTMTGVIIQHSSVYSILSTISTISNEKYFTISDARQNYIFSYLESDDLRSELDKYQKWPQHYLANKSRSLNTEKDQYHIFHSHTQINLQDQNDVWLLSITTPKSEYLDKTYLYSKVLIAIIIGIGFLAFGISIMVANYWSNPILKLAAAAEQLRDGNYSIRIPVNRKDEIGLLGETFNQMAETVHTYTTKLETLVAERTIQYHEERDKAEALSVAKGKFLANVSQEIRTPMNGILGSSTLLLDSPLNEEDHSYIKMINDSSRSLLAIVNDIIDYSNIENEKLELETVPFNLTTIVDNVYSLLKPYADNKHIEFILTLPEIQPNILLGDPSRIKQILINLIANAIKFTNEGAVELSASYMQIDDYYTIEFHIRDTGIGIPEDKLDSIYFSFTQADFTTSDRYAGTGLGLTISKSLVELMGGSLNCESIEGKGSDFSVQIKLKEFEQAHTYREVAESSTSRDYQKHILVVEDNIINQKVLKSTLEKLGVSVEMAANGHQALSLLEDKNFDLIFMDVQMPIMDGITATKILRNDMGVTTPIVAVTAKVLKEDRNSCMNAGMNGFISKPVETSDLISELDRWFG